MNKYCSFLIFFSFIFFAEISVANEFPEKVNNYIVYVEANKNSLKNNGAILIKIPKLNEAEMDSVYDYVSSMTSTPLTTYSLALLDSPRLRILRNEIYAKHNYSFKEKDLASYFNSKNWYQAQSKEKSTLSDIENENIKLIQQLENAKYNNFRAVIIEPDGDAKDEDDGRQHAIYSLADGSAVIYDSFGCCGEISNDLTLIGGGGKAPIAFKDVFNFAIIRPVNGTTNVIIDHSVYMPTSDGWTEMFKTPEDEVDDYYFDEISEKYTIIDDFTGYIDGNRGEYIIIFTNKIFYEQLPGDNYVYKKFENPPIDIPCSSNISTVIQTVKKPIELWRIKFSTNVSSLYVMTEKFVAVTESDIVNNDLSLKENNKIFDVVVFDKLTGAALVKKIYNGYGHTDCVAGDEKIVFIVCGNIARMININNGETLWAVNYEEYINKNSVDDRHNYYYAYIDGDKLFLFICDSWIRQGKIVIHDIKTGKILAIKDYEPFNPKIPENHNYGDNVSFPEFNVLKNEERIVFIRSIDYNDYSDEKNYSRVNKLNVHTFDYNGNLIFSKELMLRFRGKLTAKLCDSKIYIYNTNSYSYSNYEKDKYEYDLYVINQNTGNILSVNYSDSFPFFDTNIIKTSEHFLDTISMKEDLTCRIKSTMSENFIYHADSSYLSLMKKCSSKLIESDVTKQYMLSPPEWTILGGAPIAIDNNYLLFLDQYTSIFAFGDPNLKFFADWTNSQMNKKKESFVRQPEVPTKREVR